MRIMKPSVLLFGTTYCSLLISIVGMGLFSRIGPANTMVEICNNAIDDDMDGLVDLNDDDCDCLVVELVSFIPNPSFEDQECCPEDRGQLSCASSWIQASEPTTDYLHSCGWSGWDDSPPPVPFPDGDGIVGFADGLGGATNSAAANFKEYVGACLLRPLEKDETYRFDFNVGFVNEQKSPQTNITFFGTSDCQHLPFGQGDFTYGCPTNGPNWVELGSVSVSGNGQSSWSNATIEVTPHIDINAMAIGPECAENPSDEGLYYFLDNLLLADVRAFDLQIKEEGHPCQNNYTLYVPSKPAVNYQWYKDGITLVGEVDAELLAGYGNGDYQVLIDDGVSCSVSGKLNYIKPIIRDTNSVVICNEDQYFFGDRILSEPGNYIHTFTSINNCDSIVSLNIRVLEEIANTVPIKIFEGDSYYIGNREFRNEGDYSLTLESSIGCDSLVLLQLEYFHLYFPNVFSPNQDGTNDFFTLLYEEGLVQEFDIEIYNRWGDLVFKGQEWDGKYNGKPVSTGVFVYQANVRTNDGVMRLFNGSVNVLR